MKEQTLISGVCSLLYKNYVRVGNFHFVTEYAILEK